ncbi:MAG: ATP-binding cassette domain-containing protein [Deltaproteobacteria bacterium]|nr:ATP-binding cassette domain-containing protein [Deltaproteobacteria bacterium]
MAFSLALALMVTAAVGVRAQTLDGPAPLGGMAAGWGLVVFATGFFLLILARLPHWIRPFPTRDLVLTALTFGLAFLGVSVPHLLVGLPAGVLLGPLQFLVEGLFYKFLLFLLLGVLFALVRRPGVYALFYGLWMVAQAVFNAHTSPLVGVFAGISLGCVEAALWLGGVTRRGAVPHWFLPGVLIGLGEALALLLGFQVFILMYRLYMDTWYVLLQAAVQGGYAAAGAMAGLRLGLRLAALRRPLPTEHPGPRRAAPASPPSPDSTAPLLRATGLSLALPEANRTLLSEVSLELHPGEIVLLAGPSGGGKTTLLRILKGLLPLHPGAELSWRGIPIASLPPRDWAARCALLFQEPALQSLRDTVAAELALGLDLLGLEPPGDTPLPPDPAQAWREPERVREALKRFRLEPLAGRSLATLSGGELQRVALASLCITAPEILLLDEPLAHQDETAQAELGRMLRELTASGTAVLAAEHETASLLPLAHRVVWLEQGQLTWQGTPVEFKTFAASRGWMEIPPRRSGVPAAAPPVASRNPHQALVAFETLSGRHPGSPPLFHGISAILHAGQSVALTGDNGAGKSTLLELTLGLRRPASGRTLLTGREPHRMSWRERAQCCGYLPQRPDLLLQARTAREELAASLGGVSSTAALRLASEWLERMELEHRADTFPHLLSRGERQRLALAAVMSGGPRLLVLDEPFAGLDPLQRQKLFHLLEQFLREDSARGVLFTTHDSGAAGWADAQWRLEEGRLLVLPGPPEPWIPTPLPDRLGETPGPVGSSPRSRGAP